MQPARQGQVVRINSEHDNRGDGWTPPRQTPQQPIDAQSDGRVGQGEGGLGRRQQRPQEAHRRRVVHVERRQGVHRQDLGPVDGARHAGVPGEAEGAEPGGGDAGVARKGSAPQVTTGERHEEPRGTIGPGGLVPGDKGGGV